MIAIDKFANDRFEKLVWLSFALDTYILIIHFNSFTIFKLQFSFIRNDSNDFYLLRVIAKLYSRQLQIIYVNFIQKKEKRRVIEAL